MYSVYTLDVRLNEGIPLLVRFASSNDYDQIKDILKAAHEESIFSIFGINDAKLHNHLVNAVTGTAGNFVLAAVADDRLLGLIHGVIAQYIISSDGKVLSIQNLILAKSVRSSLIAGKTASYLLKAAAQLGRANGARLGMLSAASGIAPAAAHKLAGKIGMKAIGGNYVGILRDH